MTCHCLSRRENLMTPQEIYRRMVATIREADVRLVAAALELNRAEARVMQTGVF